MKRLIFVPLSISLLIAHFAYAQHPGTFSYARKNIHEEKDRFEVSHFALTPISKLYSVQKGHYESAYRMKDNNDQVLYFINSNVAYYDIYSDKQLNVPMERRFELVKKINTDLYNLNSKIIIPGYAPSKKKNDFKIPELMLLILKENLNYIRSDPMH